MCKIIGMYCCCDPVLNVKDITPERYGMKDITPKDISKAQLCTNSPALVVLALILARQTDACRLGLMNIATILQ